MTVVTLIVTSVLGTGTARTSGLEVPETVLGAHCLKGGKKLSKNALSYITYHGHTHDNEETADEASATVTCGLWIHIGEDITETDRYGGAPVTKKASEIASKNGVTTVELGEPIKCVPSNGRTDSL